MSITLSATEHATLSEAFADLNFFDGRVISIGRRIFTVSHDELDRIERLGVSPTLWSVRDIGGIERPVSVP